MTPIETIRIRVVSGSRFLKRAKYEIEYLDDAGYARVEATSTPAGLLTDLVGVQEAWAFVHAADRANVGEWVTIFADEETSATHLRSQPQPLADHLAELRTRFEHLGREVQDDGTELLGRAVHVAPQAWLLMFFRPLVDDELRHLDESLPRPIPGPYRSLLRQHNGLSLFSGALTLDGLRTSYDRTGRRAEPFDVTTPNVEERPRRAPSDAFYFGGYKADGSLVSIRATGEIERISTKSPTRPLNRWHDLAHFLSAEIERLSACFGDDGQPIPGTTTTPT